MNEGDLSKLRPIPAIVRMVLSEVTRLRAQGELSKAGYVLRVQRLNREELMPIGCELLTHDLPDGLTRFAVKDVRTGHLRDFFELDSDGALKAGVVAETRA